MRTYTDNLDRAWMLEINVTAIKKVKALTGVDLYKLLDNRFEGLNQLLRDPIALVDVLFALCQAQAAEKSIADEEFGRGLAGQALGDAGEAFLEELLDFFPERKAAAALQRTLARVKRAREAVLADKIAELERIPQESLEQTLKELAGISPASSVSIPAPSPSLNSS